MERREALPNLGFKKVAPEKDYVKECFEKLSSAVDSFDQNIIELRKFFKPVIISTSSDALNSRTLERAEDLKANFIFGLGGFQPSGEPWIDSIKTAYFSRKMDHNTISDLITSISKQPYQ